LETLTDQSSRHDSAAAGPICLRKGGLGRPGEPQAAGNGHKRDGADSQGAEEKAKGFRASLD